MTNTITKHHVAIYNDKIITMDYVPNPKQEFMIAAYRITDNGFDGHVVTPHGHVFFVPKNFPRKNKKLSDEEARLFLERHQIRVIPSSKKR